MYSSNILFRLPPFIFNKRYFQRIKSHTKYTFCIAFFFFPASLLITVLGPVLFRLSRWLVNDPPLLKKKTAHNWKNNLKCLYKLHFWTKLGSKYSLTKRFQTHVLKNFFSFYFFNDYKLMKLPVYPLTNAYITILSHNYLFFLSVEAKKFCCAVCGRRYKHKYLLTRHQRYECGQEPKYCCPLCPYKANYKQSLRSHVVIKHGPRIDLHL